MYKSFLNTLREFVLFDWFLPMLYPTIETRRAARLECLHLAGLMDIRMQGFIFKLKATAQLL